MRHEHITGTLYQDTLRMTLYEDAVQRGITEVGLRGCATSRNYKDARPGDA